MRYLPILAVVLVLASTSCTISEPNPPPAGGGRNPFDLDSKDNPIVVMETSMGTMKIRLYQNAAPITVANFLKYVDDKHYDGTIFHRVIETFMLQGGGFTPGLREKGSKYPPIKNEANNGLSNLRGTVAMARTGDPDSATDQFFINLENKNTFLDRSGKDAGYAVFGRVIEGMAVADKIKKVPVADRGGHEKVPLENVIIISIRRAETK
ncbi:MAG: peptidyl-prolyl cis-trans isomerase [Planctomycetes bacterium]|nr:peptidyl-prolyl cis-trans isomerase [Planctomycetota bacterium]